MLPESPDRQNRKDARRQEDKHHELLSKSNMMLKNIKREIIQLGNYGAVNDKVQSYKSFVKLIENNHMFSELICGNRNIHQHS